MRIIIPVDGSEHSRRALEFIASRTSFLKNDPVVELVNVQQSVPANLINVFDLEAVRSAGELAAAKIFDQTLSGIDFHGFEPSERVLHGDPRKEIAAEADRVPTELILMGSRGLNPLKGFIMGSVSNGVLSQTRTPVLLVRSDTPIPPVESLRVGIAADGSEYGLAAVEYVLTNAEFFGKNVTFEILHATVDYHDMVANQIYVMDAVGAFSTQEEFEKEQQKVFDEATEPAVELFETAGLKAQARRLIGEPADAIARYAQENLDLLVMGSHGRGNFTAAVMGSTAMHVAAAANLPLLIIRK